MKHPLYLLFILLILNSNVLSQNNSIPVFREIQRAIDNETRTIDGWPGQKYWQNEINYVIEASFNPDNGKVSGKETITFKNNSPNSISDLLINLYPNLFLKTVARDREVDPDDVHDGVKIKEIKINDKDIKADGPSCSYNGTNMYISLPTTLWPNNELILYIEWEFTMQSKTQIRVGKYGKNTWFIGYWYPQLAVHDDLYGWDDIQYDGLHEFYSPFANYDVKITTPSNQIVWAGGIWQNPDKILNDKYFKRYQKALESDKTTKIIEAKDLNEEILKSRSINTWHFKAENVTDFAFATSDHYLWDGLSIVVDKKTKRRTFIQTAYDKNSLDFYEVAEISKKSIQYLSDSMPGVPFPYPRMTAFNGGGGMEFPMMVNDRSCLSLSATVDLTSHEISHTYFPFYMGINQERFAWMDEGWAQFLPAEFQEQQVPYNTSAAESAFNYSYYAGNSNEMPMMIPSFFMKGYEYYIDSYYRPELAYRTLQNLLGKELFLKALQEYIHRWNGKYPSPYDFFFTFNDVTCEDLNWFWKPWFFEIAYPDLAIEDVKINNSEYEITVKNKGGLPLPITITFNYTDGTNEVISGNVKLWMKGDKTLTFNHKTNKKVKEIILGSNRIPDVEKLDNRKIFN